MGPHGLPLMGSGDWNDGMNRVEGESIWVGWFLIINLQQMAALATARSESKRAAHYLAEAKRLLSTLEAQAWDGEWYRRAYYADGTPLGSATSEECQIDSIAQSWSVIAAADNPAHTRMAMQSVWDRLVDHEAGLIRLFTPAFDQTPNDPGYIKGYLPGVRENGGQYTHAAIWAIWAYALLGDGQRVAELINLINPIRHTSSNAARYKGEPYVIAADVYASISHTGRGGWTWYTGSAGWFYRLGIEMLLGLRRTGNILTIAPCIPADWPGYTICYRYGQAEYCITVERSPAEAIRASHTTMDSVTVATGEIELLDDQQTHHIQIVLP
jgi:cyclic beta-1,2-glucan synthetase